MSRLIPWLFASAFAVIPAVSVTSYSARAEAQVLYTHRRRT